MTGKCQGEGQDAGSYGTHADREMCLPTLPVSARTKAPQ